MDDDLRFWCWALAVCAIGGGLWFALVSVLVGVFG